MMIFPPPHTSTNKGHGRVETRSITASDILNNYVEFPFCAQVFRIDRERYHVKTGKTTRERVYGITSLTADKADPPRLLQLSRNHWSIENRSHYVRDVTYNEDRHQVRTHNGPWMFACLRNFAIALMRLTGHDNIARATRKFAASVPRCLSLLGV